MCDELLEQKYTLKFNIQQEQINNKDASLEYFLHSFFQTCHSYSYRQRFQLKYLAIQIRMSVLTVAILSRENC